MNEQIQNQLVTIAKAGAFLTAVYDPETSLLSQGVAVSPASVETNEVRTAYRDNPRHGRALIQERTSWVWELHLRFEQEVITSVFENALLASPITIPRDPLNGIEHQIIVSLLDGGFVHPPRLGASNGSEITFRFSARICSN